MSVEDIKQDELTQSERDVLKEDGERWGRMGAGSHLDHWQAYYPGLAIRRTLAMKLAHTNRPEGKGYAQAFAQLMKADGLDTMDKTSVSAVLWLGDDPERTRVLRDLRNAMTPGQRSRLNSPISARQRVERSMNARVASKEDKVKESAVEMWKAKVLERDREIARLKQELAKVDNGSLFDLQKSSADDIAAVITDGSHITFKKAKEIAAAIDARLKKKQSKPAG